MSPHRGRAARVGGRRGIDCESRQSVRASPLLRNNQCRRVAPTGRALFGTQVSLRQEWHLRRRRREPRHFSLLARRQGFDAVLFEPEPRHAVFLERNASAFGIVRPWALSDTSGTATFFVAGSHNLAASSLAPPGSDAEQALYESKTTVEVETFDGALSRVGVDPAEVALIKVDVEGNEARTVRGMSDYLSNHAAPVWCEVRGPSSTRSRSSYEPVIAVMEAHGYRPHTSERGRPEAFRDHESSEVFDLLFLKRR